MTSKGTYKRTIHSLVCVHSLAMGPKSWKGLQTIYNRRKKRPSLQGSVSYKDCIKAYFDNTLLHGYRNVTDLSQSIYERGLWVFLLLAMVCAVTYVITDYYLRFINAPTATSQQASRVPISMIPFPSVVICPATRINKTAIKEFAQEMSVDQFSPPLVTLFSARL